MRRLEFLLAACTLAAAAFGVAAASAGDATTVCNGALASGTYQRVVVPQDGVCLSDGPVTIRGGLFINAGATLVLGNEENAVHTATINGGVHANNAMNVQIHFSTINGGIDIHGGSGPGSRPFWGN